MENTKFKVITLVLVSVLVLFSFVYALASPNIEKQEELLEEIESQLKALDDSHGDFVNQKNKVIRNIRALEGTVKTIEEEIRILNGDIVDNKAQVGVAETELAAAKQVLLETNDLLDDRIRVMYMNGTVGYFEVLLESKSFEDLLVRIEMLERIIKSDTSLIEQLERDKEAVDEKKRI